MKITFEPSESSLNRRVARRVLSGKTASEWEMSRDIEAHVRERHRIPKVGKFLRVAADKMKLLLFERVWK